MSTLISAKELRARLPEVVERVRRGARFTVLYRSRPAFQIVPVQALGKAPGSAAEDSLYQAGPLGRSSDGRTAAEHDAILYGA